MSSNLFSTISYRDQLRIIKFLEENDLYLVFVDYFTPGKYYPDATSFIYNWQMGNDSTVQNMMIFCIENNYEHIYDELFRIVESLNSEEESIVSEPVPVFKNKEIVNQMLKSVVTDNIPDAESLLKKHGHDIFKIEDKKGNTLLQTAILWESVEMVTWLLKNGMDVNYINPKNGKTSYQTAVVDCSVPNSKIIYILKCFGPLIPHSLPEKRNARTDSGSPPKKRRTDELPFFVRDLSVKAQEMIISQLGRDLHGNYRAFAETTHGIKGSRIFNSSKEWFETWKKSDSATVENFIQLCNEHQFNSLVSDLSYFHHQQ
jgi:hypothetical protein